METGRHGGGAEQQLRNRNRSDPQTGRKKQAAAGSVAMETQDRGEAEKVGLKRKLTGPPRLLLLGKTRTRTVGEDRSESRDKPDRSSLKSSAAAESDAADVEEEASPVCDVTAESADVTDRKAKGRRWWRRLVCFRRKTKSKKSSEKQRSDAFPPPEGALQEAEAANTEEKKMTFKRFLMSSNARRDEKPSPTLRKKLRRFLSRSPPRNEGVAAGDEPADLDTATADPGQEVVTSKMNVQPSEDTTSLEEPLTEERRVSVAVAVETMDQSEIIQTDPANANELPVDLNEVGEEAQPTTNRPAVVLNSSSIHIQLVPPDDITEEEEEKEEEEEEFWEGNQNHLLLLLGLHHSERQLLQTARCVVRAAMNAAVDQLSREQLREPPGCRDHA